MPTLTRQKIPAEFVAHARAGVSEAMRERVPRKWKTILLIGPAGTKKTTQLWALHARHVSGSAEAQAPGTHKVHVISECGDIDRYRYDWDWLDAWCDYRGCLCIDDIGYRQPRDWTVQAVYQIATQRRAHGRRTIWTTNLTFDRLREYYGAPIASRLMGGTVVQTGGDDWRASGCVQTSG